MENSSGKTFAILLFYSLLMFTLPFIAYFGSRRVLRDFLHVTGFAQTAWSVVSAVVVVNLIVFSYILKAFNEPYTSPNVLRDSQPETPLGSDGVDKKEN